MIGVVLMIVVTILLVSAVAALVLTFEDRLEEPDWQGAEHPWADNPLLAPENPLAGAEDVRYRVYFELGEAGEDPVNTITIQVDTGDDMFSGTDKDDLETFDIIRNDGTRVDLTPAESWNEDENELTIRPETGATILEDNEEAIEIIFGGVDNPAAPGTYEITVRVDQGNIEEQKGELEIIAP